MKLGVLGGTFDPIHIGHLIIAEEARIRLGLAKVLCIPAGKPWMRRGMPISAAEHRVELVRLATASNPYLEVCRMEVDRPGDTYTVDTLWELRAEWGEEAEIYFIMGADALAQLPLWRQPKEIIRLCTLVVMARHGHDQHAMTALEEELPGISTAVVWLREPQIGVSSTRIRRRVAQGISIRYWVPPEVEGYIHQHGLYREARD